MDPRRTTKKRNRLHAFAIAFLMLLGPPTLLALLLSMQVGAKLSGLAVAYVEIGLALIPGLLGTCLLKLRGSIKVLVLIAYIPAMSVSLLIWSLLFMCGVFGACL